MPLWAFSVPSVAKKKMKTLVVKIGTSTLVREGEISAPFIADLARQIAVLRAENWRVALVSSGAVRAGLDVIGRDKASNLAEKQAAAAIGQSLLMREYRVALLPHELHVAQILLTRADVANRRRFLNARHTFEQLFAWDVVPVVNENDSVSTEEIRVGDNDTLAALTALVAQADKVVLLSDVDGFYLPGRAAPETEIPEITDEIVAAAGGAGSLGATGGMKTKLDAARIARDAGIELVIASGRAPDIVLRVAREDAIGTRFTAPKRLNARKSWIAHGRSVEGTLVLNRNARAALVERGASLLPIGIERIEGEFAAGALVRLRDEIGEIGRGLCAFSSAELQQIAGRKTDEVGAILGRDKSATAVHRDNLSLSV